MTTTLALLQQAVSDTGYTYGHFPGIGGRGAVWIAAEVHLMFAAFVLGVPMFAVITELIGIVGKDEGRGDVEHVNAWVMDRGRERIYGRPLAMGKGGGPGAGRCGRAVGFRAGRRAEASWPDLLMDTPPHAA